MPMIRVELLPGRSVEQKREFAKSVTDLAANVLKCGADDVSVVFDEVTPNDWANGGVLVADKKAANPKG